MEGKSIDKTTRKPVKGYRGIGMDWMAKWYAKNTRTNMAYFQTLGRRLAENLPDGSSVLEVAPGPGYLAIEIARLGNYRVTGLDISRAMVEIARQNAAEAGVTVAFRQGNASDMPFDDENFDLIVCCAAFNYFSDPVGALREMYRVLMPQGKALIIDLRKDTPSRSIYEYVDQDMKEMSPINRMITKWSMVRLKKRAYTKKDIENFVSQTSFKNCEIFEASIGIGMEIWLEKNL